MISPFWFAMWVVGMGMLGCTGVILGTVGLVWAVLEVVDWVEKKKDVQ